MRLRVSCTALSQPKIGKESSKLDRDQGIEILDYFNRKLYFTINTFKPALGWRIR